MPTFLERYQAGDRVAVWDELVALGEGVRNELYYADAAAVATETMRRARHNVELLIQRLDGMGFRFLTMEAYEKNHREALGRLYKIHKQVASEVSRPLDWLAFLKSEEARLAVGAIADHSRAMAAEFMEKTLAGKPVPLENRDVFDPPTKKTAEDLDKLEERAGGPLPLSLRAWYEQVGGVSLLGWHSVLYPNADEPAGLSGMGSDPLMIEPLDLLLEIVEMESDGEEEEGIRLSLAPDETFKAGEGGGDAYWMAAPNPCADGIFEDDNGRTFVNYLRNAFAWGGFPGWESDANPAREIAAKLAEGLLPL